VIFFCSEKRLKKIIDNSIGSEVLKIFDAELSKRFITLSKAIIGDMEYSPGNVEKRLDAIDKKLKSFCAKQTALLEKEATKYINHLEQRFEKLKKAGDVEKFIHLTFDLKKMIEYLKEDLKQIKFIAQNSDDLITVLEYARKIPQIGSRRD
jgi:hypothetical protein